MVAPALRLGNVWRTVNVWSPRRCRNASSFRRLGANRFAVNVAYPLKRQGFERQSSLKVVALASHMFREVSDRSTRLTFLRMADDRSLRPCATTLQDP